MQEEVENRTVNLAISTTKLTGRTITVRLRDLAAVLADAAERGRSVQTQARRILHHDKYAAIGAALFAHDEDLVLRIDREHLLALDGADAGAVIAPSI